MERYIEIQLPGINGPWLSETKLDPGVRTESQGEWGNCCDPVNPSCLTSTSVLGLMMDLSLWAVRGQRFMHEKGGPRGITENSVPKG